MIYTSTYIYTLHRHNVTYITYTKSLHLRNLNWKKRLNSKQLHHVFYVTVWQPEIESKISEYLLNTNITYKNFLFMNNI